MYHVRSLGLCWRETPMRRLLVLQPRPHLNGVITLTASNGRYYWLAKNVATKQTREGYAKSLLWAKRCCLHGVVSLMSKEDEKSL